MDTSPLSCSNLAAGDKLCYRDSPGIVLLQLGVVLYSGNQLISQLFTLTHLAVCCRSDYLSGAHKDSPSIILLKLGVVLSADNKLISQLFI